MLNTARDSFNALISSHRWSETLAGDALRVLSSQLVLRGGFALVSLAAARTLPVATFTNYNLFLVNSALMASLTSLGLPVAVSLASSRFRAGHDIEHARVQIDRAFALFAVLVLMQLVAVPMIVRWLPTSTGESKYLGLYAIAGAILANVNSMMFAVLSGMRLYRRLALISASGVVALSAGYLVSLLLHSITPLLASNLLFYAIPCAFAFRRLQNVDMLPRRSPHWSDLASYMPVVRIALPSFGSGILFSYANWLISTTLLARQSLPIMFSTFAIGMQWFAMLLFVPTAVGMAAFSHFVAASAQGTLSLRLIAFPAISAFLMGLVLCVLATVAAPLLDSIYGGRFAIDRLFVATILLAASCSAATAIIANAVITASGAGVWLRMNVIYAATVLVGVLLIHPRTAIEGAAILAVSNIVLILAASIQLWFSLGRLSRAAER